MACHLEVKGNNQLQLGLRIHPYFMRQPGVCVCVYAGVTPCACLRLHQGVCVCQPKLTFSPGFPVGPFAPLPPRAPYWKTNNSLISACITHLEVEDKRLVENTAAK